jgi:hypothetical protein
MATSTTVHTAPLMLQTAILEYMTLAIHGHRKHQTM